MPHILVVDDSDTDRCLIGGLLAGNSEWQVEYAVEGRDAFERIGRRVPDLVLTDLLMPVMNGLELVDAVRKKYPHVPVVLMTSLGNEALAVEALRRGAASYVSKQRLASKLPETIADVLSITRRAKSQALLHGQLCESLYRFELENDPAQFAPLLNFIWEETVQFRLWDDAEAMRVGIALHEALSNALYHGNLEVSTTLREVNETAYHAQIEEHRSRPPYCRRRIAVEAAFSRAAVRFVVRDGGPGFNPASLPDPTDPENLERTCGRGILLMQTFMDEVRYNETGNAVTLVKWRHPTKEEEK
ncbi:MAG: ATP-binding protein [Pirellulales bacterium]|nr:ATP-binding protein [Pirellulales bacterium]